MSFTAVTEGRLLMPDVGVSVNGVSVDGVSVDGGSRNMAIDEVMLDQAANEGELLLRFYSWDRPTVSLGYFQELNARQTHRPSADGPLVRRSSGGGAIIHGPPRYDLTYAVAVPSNRSRGALVELYDCFHDSLIEVMRGLGLPAFRCDADRGETPKPFLCFQRHTKGDVLVGPHKIGGSAQRRRKMAVLQHGTLLLDTLPEAPELPGARQLHDNRDWQPPSDFALRWLNALGKHWPVQWRKSKLTDAERSQIETYEEKYTDERWTARR